jgi:hypothetical protein
MLRMIRKLEKILALAALAVTGIRFVSRLIGRKGKK